MTPEQAERMTKAFERVADALERMASGAKAAPVASGVSGPTFGFGRGKGKPVAGASQDDLDYYANAALRSLGDPSKSNFHAKEQALYDAIVAEQERRGFPVTPAF